MQSDILQWLPEGQRIARRYTQRHLPTDTLDGACGMARQHLMAELSLGLHDLAQLSTAAFEPYSIGLLVDYLRRSHRYYMNEALPQLQHTVAVALHHCPEGHALRTYAPPLVRRFMDETLAHIQSEESHLFPYAIALEQAGRRGAVHVPMHPGFAFGESHHAELDPERLEQLLQKLSNGMQSNMAWRIAMKQLRHLGEDLKLHALIEDEVLIPKLKRAEAQLGQG